ncbi:MAG: mevalonate kinase, partial [Candidatus Freyarchaeota archaeon]|nr:mevalonate kinase [Candidatus Jordarchaeia archaeon]
SSAAVAVAATAAISSLHGISLSKREIYDISFEAEKDVHETPSGVDNAIATYGSAIVFRRGRVRRIKIDEDIPFVLGDTGVRRSTKDWVAKVRERRERCKEAIDPIIRLIGRIAMKGAYLLREKNLEELGELMDINQGLLDALGVSTQALNSLIFAARSAGACGAKLTGAGGGGCMVALTPKERSNTVADAIRNAGGIPIITSISREGVRFEARLKEAL